jgi:hypothetical protein
MNIVEPLQEWTNQVFDPPVTDPPWRRASPEFIALHIADTFEQAGGFAR